MSAGWPSSREFSFSYFGCLVLPFLGWSGHIRFACLLFLRLWGSLPFLSGGGGGNRFFIGPGQWFFIYCPTSRSLHRFQICLNHDALDALWRCKRMLVLRPLHFFVISSLRVMHVCLLRWRLRASCGACLLRACWGVGARACLLFLCSFCPFCVSVGPPYVRLFLVCSAYPLFFSLSLFFLSLSRSFSLCLSCGNEST